MGMPWPTPLIQLLATSEDQVDNVYRPLQAMARGPYLSSQMRVGESFIRLPNDGRIDVVTSSAQSRLGNPITFALQDETQLYTAQNKLIKVAETMRRGLAGMGGRSMETTNCWDPGEQSVAQRTYEAKASDVFKFYETPPPTFAGRARLSAARSSSSTTPVLRTCRSSRCRPRPRNSTRTTRDRPSASTATGSSRATASWMDAERWTKRAKPREVEPGTQVTVGFDGSDVDDWTGFRCETRDGYQFTPTFPDGSPDDLESGEVRRQGSARRGLRWPGAHRGDVQARPPLRSTRRTGSRTWTPGPRSTARTSSSCAGTPSGRRRCTRRPSACYTDLGKTDSAFWHDGCTTTRDHVQPLTRPRGRLPTLRAATSSASRETVERSTWRSPRSSRTRHGAT
jgi:hypothetical protein